MNLKFLVRIKFWLLNKSEGKISHFIHRMLCRNLCLYMINKYTVEVETCLPEITDNFYVQGYGQLVICFITRQIGKKELVCQMLLVWSPTKVEIVNLVVKVSVLFSGFLCNPVLCGLKTTFVYSYTCFRKNNNFKLHLVFTTRERLWEKMLVK